MRGQATLSDSMPLRDLSGFDSPPANWQIVGAVIGHPDESFGTSPGEGILVNQGKVGQGRDLYTTWQHGDLDFSCEFLMPPGGNSGIYLMGRYEIQLADSWGKSHPTFADCGGVYQRWDESQPEGDKGYGGQSPRQNAAKAPGLWQDLRVSFQAPRFDAKGHKTQAARLLSVHLNGVLIHENVELTGPTRGSAFPEEGPQGPIRIQGDHGPVALRNLRYEPFSMEMAQTGPFKYAVYLGKYDRIPDLSTLTVARTGQSDVLTQSVAGESKDFILRLEGPLTVSQNGVYHFDLNALGMGSLSIDGQVVAPAGQWQKSGSMELKAGTHKLEVIYGKDADWYNNGLSLTIEGPQLRRQTLSVISSMPIDKPENPIYLEVGAAPKVMRCFIDYRDQPDAKTKRRIVHAINVGLPVGLSFTYDPDRAAWVQAWKGPFLDASPMWITRGNGSSRPRGSLIPLGDEAGLGLLVNDGGAWSEELPAALKYDFDGYRIDGDGLPRFEYHLDQTLVTDQIRSEDGKSLIRQLTVGEGLQTAPYLRLAQGQRIEEISKGRYSVDQRFYLELLSKTKPMLREVDGHQELLLPLRSETDLRYRLIW
jgi:hypothetical protein